MFFKIHREKLFLLFPASWSFWCSLACGCIATSTFIFSGYFPVYLLLRLCAMDSCFWLLQSSQSSAKVPSPKSGHIHRFRGSGPSPLFLRFPSCHCFCLATHPLQIASWDTHCLRWTLHQSRQQPWWILVTPFGNDWHRGEAQGWEISWHEMGLGCEAARETEKHG